MGEEKEVGGVVCRGGGGEERMAEEEEEHGCLTDLGERLLILEGCTQKGGSSLSGGGDECLPNSGGYLCKVHR